MRAKATGAAQCHTPAATAQTKTPHNTTNTIIRSNSNLISQSQRHKRGVLPALCFPKANSLWLRSPSFVPRKLPAHFALDGNSPLGPTVFRLCTGIPRRTGNRRCVTPVPKQPFFAYTRYKVTSAIPIGGTVISSDSTPSSMQKAWASGARLEALSSARHCACER